MLLARSRRRVAFVAVEDLSRRLGITLAAVVRYPLRDWNATKEYVAWTRPHAPRGWLSV